TVDVPNFLHAPLSMSGILVATRPSPSIVPDGAMTGFLPIAPTNRRDFRASDRATALVRVYQGGSGPLAPVTLALKLLDDTGPALANDTVSLDAARFDVSRTAQQTLDLPISRLGPGRSL